MKESVTSFLSNILSVILGIFITFTIQGMIDRSKEKKETRSSLELVRSELVTNMDDISIMADYLHQEKASAEYILSNKDSLDSCPEDSVNYHSSMIFADVSFSLSQDALELLKMSSVFQSIKSNGLSMKIIRAYDSCSSIVYNLNRHLSSRDARFENSIDKETAGLYALGGNISIKDFIKTDYGLYSIKWLTAQPDPENFTDVSDIQEAVHAIDSYLGKKRRTN
ncbi:MAG: hypothetical protein IJL58_09635 [Bacteroidales bacterium]|nr:hypothetical protein [Bacteroidales bacterium]